MAVSSKGKKGNEIVFGADDVKDAPQKFKSKKEFRISKQVHDRVSEMAEARKSSSPFPKPLGGGTGTDWAVAWRRWMKQYIMHREYVRGRSNLKAATAFSAVETFLNEFQEVHNAVIFTPVQERDARKVRLHAEIERYWENKVDAADLQALTAKDTAIYGTQVPFTGWQRNIREVEMLVTGEDVEIKVEELFVKKREELAKLKSLTDEEAEQRLVELQEQKQAEIDKMLRDVKPFTKKEELVDFEDVVYVPTEIFDIYVDPGAITLMGPNREAIDIAWIQTVTEGQFKSEFRNSTDPFVIKKNINKVKGSAAALGAFTDLGKKPFFDFLSKLRDDQVQVIRYYNKATDSHVILANDIVVRSGPLPYNHKQLPFTRHRLFTLKDHFYGFGFPAALEYVQAEIESGKNLNLDAGKARLQPSVFIQDDIFDDIDQGWEVGELGKKIPVSGSVGPDNVRWFEGPQFNMDYYQMNDLLEQQSIKISGMNPAITGLTAPGERVRNNLTNLESSLKSVKKLIRNYMVGWRDSALQRVFLRMQFLPSSYIQQMQERSTLRGAVDITGGKSMVSVGGDIDELEIEVTEESGGDARESIQLDSIDMMINIDALAPVSQGLKIQNAEKAFATMLPLLQNPESLSNPLVVSLLREIFEVNGFDKKALEMLQDETAPEDIGNAAEQERLMLLGEVVPGIPGESLGHQLHHANTLLELLSERERMTPEETTIEDLDKINAAIDLLGQHQAIDLMEKTVAPEAVLSAVQPQGQTEQLPEEGLVPEQAIDMQSATGVLSPI